MNAEKLAQALIFFIPFLFSLSFHEAAHAFLAEKRGDPTAKLLGRKTLNPLAHIDILGTVIFPLISILFGDLFIGWAKPVPVNSLNLKNPRKDNLLISAAGPVSNLIMAVFFAIAVKAFYIVSPDVVRDYFARRLDIFQAPILTMLDMGIKLNIALALFNLIPVPPLDGSHILEGVLPASYGGFMEKYRQADFIIFMLLLFSGILRFLSYPIGLIYITILRFFL